MGALAAFMLRTRQLTGALCRFNLTYGAQVHPKCRKCSIWLGTINACILAATGSSTGEIGASQACLTCFCGGSALDNLLNPACLEISELPTHRIDSVLSARNFIRLSR